MNWLLMINDARCSKEFEQFLKKNAEGLTARKLESLHKPMDSSVGKQPIRGSEFIAINSASSVDILKVSDIMHCLSNRSYTELHLNNGNKITVTKTLKQFESALIDHRFVRVHQSHIVNMNYITKYVKGESGYVLLTNGTKLPVSLRKKEQLFRELKRI